MSSEIIVDISPDGKTVTVNGNDTEGGNCKLLTKELEQALGTVTHEEFKPAFHKTRVVPRKVGR